MQVIQIGCIKGFRIREVFDLYMGHESEILDGKLLYNPEWPFILIPEFNFEFWVGIKLLKLIWKFKTIS